MFSLIFLNNEMKEDILKVVQNLPNQDGAIDTIMMGMTINGLMWCNPNGISLLCFKYNLYFTDWDKRRFTPYVAENFTENGDLN